MKRKIILSCLAIAAALSLHAQTADFETATTAVGKMNVGWNLGNSLDSHASGVSDPTETETLRNQPVTQPELMEMMKLAGFNAIRVPVTWYPHMDDDGTVDAAWMTRVREVVDYVIGEGMYCIVDVHHDTGKTDAAYPSKGWIRATMDNYNQNKEKFEYLWTQIANEFKDYGELLLFEGYNEILDKYDSYNYATFKHGNRYDATEAQDAYDAVNAYARSFVEAVRATGGNNAMRNLVVNTYGACTGYGSWNTHLQDPLTEMQNPEEGDHIIFGVHAYPQILDETLDPSYNSETPMRILKSDLTAMFNGFQYNLASKGAPVIIGEYATANVDKSPNDYDAHREHYFIFLKNLLTQAKSNNVATFYWMGLSHRDFRAMPAFNQSDLAETLLTSWYGSGYQSTILTPDDYDKSYDVTFTNVWGELQLAYDASDLRNDYTGIEVEFDDISGIDGGILSFRMYSSTSAYVNFRDISALSNTINFTDVSVNPLQRITIVWRTSGKQCNVKVRSVNLIRSDGTKEEAVVSIKTPERATMTTLSSPRYGKSKIKVEGKATLYYGDRNLIVPADITATTYKIADNTLQEVSVYQTGDVIPAGTGVVLNGENNRTYIFYPSDETGTPSVGSMLRGTDEDALTTGGDAYYMLSRDKESTEGSVGFYFAKPDGAAFVNKAHRAYLAVTADEAPASMFLLSDALGISELSTRSDSQESDRWYTLSGTLLGKKPTKAGIYINNGRKVVVK